MDVQKKIYIFVGPPGCGKGTLSSACIKELGWAQLSTGNMCRKHILEGTEIGKTIDFIIKSGKLIADNLIVDLVKTELDTALATHDVVILDGFPRTKVQANLFFDIVRDQSLQVNIIQFVIDYDVLFKRLAHRVVCSNKDCQAVYSMAPGSSLIPHDAGLCDVCHSPLIKREDDMPHVVERRLKDYEKQADQVLEFYKEHDMSVIQLLVDKPIQDVFVTFKKLNGLVA